MDKLSGWIQKVASSAASEPQKAPISVQNSVAPHSNQNRPPQPIVGQNGQTGQVGQSGQKRPQHNHPNQNRRPHQSQNPNAPHKSAHPQNPNQNQNPNSNQVQNRTENSAGNASPRKNFTPHNRQNPTENFVGGRPKKTLGSVYTPSRPVSRSSVATRPDERRQRPRPMMGMIKRNPAKKEYVQTEKFPEGIPMRVLPFGGLNEVGKNSMGVEYDGKLLIVDIGLQFPEENMPGIDYVIPDLSYAVANKHNIQGLLITHGHLDHIGAIHHYMEKLDFPTIYATKLTKALIEKRLEEAEILAKTKIIEVTPDGDAGKFSLGPFQIEYFRVNHSIPDSCGIYIKTPAGSMVHTGDFKFDLTPIDGHKCDFYKMTKIAKEGVDVIFADSTNALRDGFCPSEKMVADNIGKVVRDCKGRLIVATFSSSIGRHQAIIEHAVANGRKVFVSGRSMNDNIAIAHDLGFINVPKSAIRKLGPHLADYPAHEILILTTGSQGEPFAALSRVARDEHPFIQLEFDDTIMLSSSPIPGNERALYTVIDMIYRKGAKIVTRADIDIHASGHAFQGDIKMMHSLMEPKYIVPIHGEYFMRVGHRELAIKQMGYEENKVIMLENGSVLEVLGGVVRKAKEGLPNELIFIDGKDHADISEKILAERTAMSEGGVVTVLLELEKSTRQLKKEPRIFSEGFLESPHVHGVLMDQTKISYAQIYSVHQAAVKEKDIVEAVSNHLHTALLQEVDREPVIQVLVTLS